MCLKVIWVEGPACCFDQSFVTYQLEVQKKQISWKAVLSLIDPFPGICIFWRGKKTPDKCKNNKSLCKWAFPQMTHSQYTVYLEMKSDTLHHRNKTLGRCAYPQVTHPSYILEMKLEVLVKIQMKTNA